MRNPVLTFVVATMLAGAVSSTYGADVKAGEQVPEQYKTTRTLKINVNYLLFLPKGYEAGSEKKWPLIFFLHGAGERGTNVWKVAVHGPPKRVAGDPGFPFIVVSPQCPSGERWSNDVLVPLLDDIIAKHAVDTNRVYLTGLSMGGYGTWNLGLTYPERFAAIAPICGGGEMITLLLKSYDNGAALRSLPVWAFHGAKDPVVPLSESERMVDGLKKVGLKEVKFTVYPEAQHDSWTETYANPEFYKWLLEHKR